MKHKLRWIAGIWKPLKGWFVVLLLLTVLSTAVAISYPLVLGLLLDMLHPTAATENAYPGFIHEFIQWARGPVDAAASADAVFNQRVATIVWLMLAIGLARFGAGFYPAVRAHINLQIERNVRETYFAYILRKGYRFFLRFRTGDLVTRLTDDIADYPKIAWFCCSGIFRAVESGSKFLFCLAVMLMLDWRLALLAIAPLPLMLVAFAVVHKRLAKAVEAQRRAVSETNDLLESSFSGVRIIKAWNAEDRQTTTLREQLERRIEAEMAVVRMWQIIDSMYNSLNVVGQIIVIAVGGMFVIQGQLSVGAFYAFYVYLGMLVQPLLDLPNLFVTGRQAFVCIDREEEMRRYDPEGEGGAFRGGTATPAAFQTLALDGVSFRWPALAAQGAAGPERDEFGNWVRPESTGEAGDGSTAPQALQARDVLCDIDLTLRRGEKVAIVGRLGAGKSTLLHIAAGYLVPTAGEVRLNDRALATYDQHAFGRLVGVVPQEPVLFSETVRENVVFGRANDDALLAEVLDAVGMTDEVANFPDGLDQKVGQRGITLSGGQRQRLTIARALYGKPSLLLLDDLTSALDARNEDRLWRALRRLTPDASLLVVTHRIATARAMDRICVLDDGAIVASGSHEELLQASPLYREFQHQWTDDAAAS